MTQSNAQLPADFDPHALPTLETSRLMAKMAQSIKPPRRGIVQGFIARTDSFPVDENIASLEKIRDGLSDSDPQKANIDALISRTLSVSDLTPKTYDRFKQNPNAFSSWYPQLAKAIADSNSPFKTPASKCITLPIELAQFMRIEYGETTEQDKKTFNNFVFHALALEDDKTYFIKTGNFSMKFEFHNARCTEPREMGEYFQVINNFAMQVGAGTTVELVAREYIKDVEDNPTIYNGMPLRTEFRAFVDFDANTLIGIVPYWHPIVMKRALNNPHASPEQQERTKQDFVTYCAHEDALTAKYNDLLPTVRRELKALIPHVGLSGRYSVDVMKNGDDLYVIDMALMAESALSELLDNPDYNEPAFAALFDEGEVSE